VGRPPRQSPYKRAYPNGRVVWVARFSDLAGKARYAKPRWNGHKATFARKRDAQFAIDEALERQHGIPVPRRLDDYFETWAERHPRSPRTNKSNADRIALALEIEVDGRRLGEWDFDELRRCHALEFLDYLLRIEGRAAQGARNIVSALSAMTEDAIGDDAAIHNAFAGLRIRESDPRVRKERRRIRTWSFDEMRTFARGGRAELRAATRRPLNPRLKDPNRERFYPPRDYEALLLTPGFTGLRLGEFLALKESEFDGRSFHLHVTAHEGELIASSPQKKHKRLVPVPPTLSRLLARRPSPGQSEFLFPTPRGKLWRESNFYRDVWVPAERATGLDPTPHEFRHSYVSNLRAAGIDDADLAEIVGQEIKTMIAHYTHPLQRSHGRVRQTIG
jgi:integrase